PHRATSKTPRIRRRASPGPAWQRRVAERPLNRDSLRNTTVLRSSEAPQGLLGHREVPRQFRAEVERLLRSISSRFHRDKSRRRDTLENLAASRLQNLVQPGRLVALSVAVVLQQRLPSPRLAQ